MPTSSGKKNQKNRPQKKATRKESFKLAKWFSEELIKHEFFTYVGKGIGWLFTNYTATIAVITSVGTWVLQLWEGTPTLSWVLYIQTHPARISVAAMAIALFSPAIKVLISSLGKRVVGLFSHREIEEREELSEADQLVRAVGISGFYSHATKAEKKRDWKACVEKIKSHRAKDLRIMGATGWNTFGAPESPLYKLLEQFNGEIKVLLMTPDPALPALIQRAKETQQNPAGYASEITRSVERLKALRGRGKNISLKFYTQMPVWKMLISNDYMWLQHYRSSKNVEETPVYVFFSDGDEGTSLFHALYSVWLKRWEFDQNAPYDLMAT